MVSEKRYRRLFESAKDGILIADFETGLIVDVNKFLIELLGYSKDDFLKKHLWDIGVFKNIVASKANFEELKGKEVISLFVGERLVTNLEGCLSLNYVPCPSFLKRPLTPERYRCFSNPDGFGHWVENNIVLI